MKLQKSTRWRGGVWRGGFWHIRVRKDFAEQRRKSAVVSAVGRDANQKYDGAQQQGYYSDDDNRAVKEIGK